MIRAVRRLQRVQGEPSDAGNAPEVLIDGEDTGTIFQCNGCDQRIDSCQHDAFRAGEAKDDRSLTIRRESARLEHFPLREVALYRADVAGESLQNFGGDDSRGGKRLRLGDHPAQFSASTTGM